MATRHLWYIIRLPQLSITGQFPQFISNPWFHIDTMIMIAEAMTVDGTMMDGVGKDGSIMDGIETEGITMVGATATIVIMTAANLVV